jgi:glutamate-5-semialdehyde dehydrogenase
MMEQLNNTFAAVQAASRKLALLTDDQINSVLLAVADAAVEHTAFILSENQKDLERM